MPAGAVNVTISWNVLPPYVRGTASSVNEPRLLKFDPGRAAAPMPRNPFDVVPAKVELLYVSPSRVDEAATGAPLKAPCVLPAKKTSSACATAGDATRATASPSPATAFREAMLRIISSLLRLHVLPIGMRRRCSRWRDSNDVSRAQTEDSSSVSHTAAPSSERYHTSASRAPTRKAGYVLAGRRMVHRTA